MKRVLVVDDDEFFRTLVTNALERSGYETLEATSGSEGVKLAQQHLPDLILSDIMMDEGDGYDALKVLRTHPSTAAIPFIFMTGMSDQEHWRRGMNSGADDYLIKPFTSGDLIAAVQTRLHKLETFKERSDRKLSELRRSLSTMLPHELRTPLTGIIGSVELLIEGQDDLSVEEANSLVHAIHKSAQRLYHLIENFSLYSQVELWKSDPQQAAQWRSRVTTMPQALIETAARKAAQAHDRLADLRVALQPGAAGIHDLHLSKVVEELVDNAFKFSASGTEVRVTAGPTPQGYAVTIRDHGRGMTADQIASIDAHAQFERRFHEQQGAGLGLVIAKGLVELHGGRWRIESQAGSGTEVSSCLPLST